MSAEPEFDVVVIGTGPGGRGVAPALAAAGKRVAVVEDELVGGECPFWACIPSKTLLRPGQLRAQAGHVAGVSVPELDWAAIRDYRDYMNSGLDDGAKADWMSGIDGVTLVRGRATVPERGLVVVGDRELRCTDVVIASGTHPAIPDLPGLEREHVWTNREVTSLEEIPSSAVVLGGGAVGLEVAQYLQSFGSQVTLLQRSGRLLTREEPEVGEHAARVLREHGVDVRLDTSIASVRHHDGRTQVTTDAGDVLDVERLVVAAGRSPRIDGLTPDGVTVEHGLIRVDEQCRAADGIWAVGDITGEAPFTHVAGYQGRVVVDALTGGDAVADYRAIPRVVFLEPEIAAVGLTADAARERGIAVRTTTLALSGTDRTETYGRGLEGGVGLVLDAGEDVLVGAWAVGPEAGEWIHTPALAIKASIPLAVLKDFVPQFPTFSELWGAAFRQL
ncbi:NAD(P)/FAD-dependent oxidoreductase [Patulibacter sp. NPDC049589]|uniref:dihydrolipoyl dehydrogenase family protein n=1 Tax=Patulibacter sp. NPDC049589 TaxID=3154731 RepID=UPI00343B96F0